MKTLDLLRSLAARPSGYLLRRGSREVWRRVTGPLLARRLRKRSEALIREGGAGRANAWRTGDLRLGLDRTQRREAACLLRREHPEEVALLRDRCERILNHEFDLLGSGPTRLGSEIDWHRDFKSGRRWQPSRSAYSRRYISLEDGSDVKVAWELSRCHHLVTLGQGWTLFGDRRYSEEFQRQVLSWISLNRLGFGINWACTMEVAIRAVNWIWALTLFEDAALEPGFEESILTSLFEHGQWIPLHLEEAPVNGNHYLSDLLGMIACGALFSTTPMGRRWLADGIRLFEREILTQVGEDGVNIEGSIYYHALVLEILLVGRTFATMARHSLSEDFDRRLRSMFEFLFACTPPSGRAPMVGDADDGRVLSLGNKHGSDFRHLLSTGCVIFEEPAWKEQAGKCWPDSIWLLGPQTQEAYQRLDGKPVFRSQHFSESGFHVLRTRRQYLFVDAGPVGFCGRGGHGHNDCLSFEWHLDGQPLLTDSGSYVYTADSAWRNRFRSTAAHNTIRIDGEELNRFRSPGLLWDLHDDARPVGVEWKSSNEFETLRASHTGYRRLSSPVTVSRCFELDHGSETLRIRDSIQGKGRHLVEVFFHVAPGARRLSSGEGVRADWPEDGSGLTLSIRATSGADWIWEEEESWFSPSYGVKTSRPVWIASTETDLPLEVLWTLRVDQR